MNRPPATVSSGSRYLFVLVAGVLIGVVATVMLLRAWQARQDPYPRSLMQLMAHQLDGLQHPPAQGACSAAEAAHRLGVLALVAKDIESAFPDLRDDARFGGHADRLRQAVAAAAAAPIPGCPAQLRLARQIDEACAACHQEFD